MMNTLNSNFRKAFGTHWIDIKFYKKDPEIKEAKYLHDVRFCEATKKAVTHPVILDKNSINCPGALFAFGWKSVSSFYKHCLKKSKLTRNALRSIIPELIHLDGTFQFIGLNTEQDPDVIMSYVTPAQIMKLLYLYHNKEGKTLDISLCSMMSICSGIAVKSYVQNEITFSFGCSDSRTYAKIGKERLAVGIPKKHFDLVQSKKNEKRL